MNIHENTLTASGTERRELFYFNARLRKVKNFRADASVSFDFNDGLRLLNNTAAPLLVQAYSGDGECESWFAAPGRAVQSRAAYFVRWNFEVRSAQNGEVLFRYRWNISGAPAGFRLGDASPEEKLMLLAAIRKFCRRERCRAVIAGAMELRPLLEIREPAWLWCEKSEPLFTAACWHLAGNSCFSRRIPAPLQEVPGRRFARQILKV